jgi:hypothetical protein
MYTENEKKIVQDLFSSMCQVRLVTLIEVIDGDPEWSLTAAAKEGLFKAILCSMSSDEMEEYFDRASCSLSREHSPIFAQAIRGIASPESWAVKFYMALLESFKEDIFSDEGEFLLLVTDPDELVRQHHPDYADMHGKDTEESERNNAELHRMADEQETLMSGRR